MDFIIFFSVAIFITALHMKNDNAAATGNELNDVEEVKRTTKLNDNFYHDDNAFCEIINALGFNNIGGKL